MNDRETFKENLNFYLEYTGKMQKELADYVGAKYTTVSGWTRGVSYPRADAMEKIANFFDIPTTQLIGERDPKQSSVLSDDERELISLYRGADDRAREDAIDTLRKHQKKDMHVQVIK